MDLLLLLKKLKEIEPEKDYTLKSRSLILGESFGTASSSKIWHILWSNVEFGASLALMVAMVYIMLGGFSTWKITAPLQVSNLDPASLAAEAQAIDVQIQLTNLNYQGGVIDSLKLSESTPAAAPQSEKSASPENGGASSETKATSTESNAPSIDEALDMLSQ